MRIFLKNGLWIQDERQSIAIDAKNGKKAGFSLISHAHSDHYGTGKASAFATAETIALIQNNKPQFDHCKPVLQEKKQKIGEMQATFHNAGHVLGSSQISVEADGKKILFSGDFNPVDSILFQGAKAQPCDSLVLETTFGLPEYQFPEREKVHEEMGKWVQQNIKQKKFTVLAGYALGKAQELTRICNEYANEIPLVHDKIFLHNQTYEKFGTRLGKFIALNQNLDEANVLIMPPSLLDKNIVPALEYSLHKKVVTGMATGWSHRNGYDQVFPLSDHADYNHLMEFVQECNPKQVYTVHGFCREFASAVQRKLKIPCRALGEKSQSTLGEFELA